MRKLLLWAGRLLNGLTVLALCGGLIDPRDFWLPAMFGPVLPLLLFCITAYAIALLYRRQWREAIVPVLLVILALPAWRRSVAFSTNEVAITTSDTTLTVITANLATLKAPAQDNYPLNDSLIADLGRRLAGADVLFAQEFNHSATDRRTHILQRAGQYPHFLKAENGRMAIFSRHALRAVQERFRYNSVNGFLVADLDAPGGTLRLFNVHLHSNRVTGLADRVSKGGRLNDGGTWQTIRHMFGRYGRASALRCEQAETIATLVANSPHPVLLGGDFNDVPNSYPYRLLATETGLRDAWIEGGTGLGKTFAGNLPGLRIDYVLADPTLGVVEAEKLAPGHSDHHPLRVRLRR